jgi:hypothetical protein
MQSADVTVSELSQQLLAPLVACHGVFSDIIAADGVALLQVGSGSL